MSTPAIDLRNVSVSHAGRRALRDITLQCSAGDLLLLTGPNGGGKTTLLRVILGLQQPDKGEVLLFGQRPDQYKKQFGVGYVPQRIMAINAGLAASVEDILESACVIHCVGGTVHDEHQAQVIADLQLAPLLKRPITSLSGGERQKVFIARALLSGAKLLLLDEPTTGVDRPSQESFRVLLQALQKRGVTVVVASHEPSFFAPLTSSAYCIDETAALEEVSEAHSHHVHVH